MAAIMYMGPDILKCNKAQLLSGSHGVYMDALFVGNTN